MGFYSRAVRFFTKSKWSHCFIVIDNIYGTPAVLEADLKVQVVDFHQEYIEKQDDVYEIYRPIKAKQEDIAKATEYCYRNYAGKIYGFLQIPWFAIRSILGFFGIKGLGKNWFPSGIICSELVADYLYFIDPVFHELTSNETSPEDLYLIVKSRPDLFERVGF